MISIAQGTKEVRNVSQATEVGEREQGKQKIFTAELYSRKERIHLMHRMRSRERHKHKKPKG